MSIPPDAFDSPWEAALTSYFSEFMVFFFPQAHSEIDWTHEPKFLERELAQVVRDAELGKRVVDKLVEVRKTSGDRQWVYIHIEVQGRHDGKFAQRMFTYNYRLFDRYKRPIASLAVLSDTHPHWRPDTYGYCLFGCEARLTFPIIKLCDYAPRIDWLLTLDNAFALITAAHLLTQQTHGDGVKRYIVKTRLTKLLYKRGWGKQRIIDLYNVIDWMMRLPADKEAKLLRDLNQFERKHNMRYISSAERIGIEQGLKQGLEQGHKLGLKEGQAMLLERQLAKRFGPLPAPVHERLMNAGVTDLTRWGEAVLDASTLDSIFTSYPAAPSLQPTPSRPAER